MVKYEVYEKGSGGGLYRYTTVDRKTDDSAMVRCEEVVVEKLQDFTEKTYVICKVVPLVECTAETTFKVNKKLLSKE